MTESSAHWWSFLFIIYTHTNRYITIVSPALRCMTVYGHFWIYGNAKKDIWKCIIFFNMPASIYHHIHIYTVINQHMSLWLLWILRCSFLTPKCVSIFVNVCCIFKYVIVCWNMRAINVTILMWLCVALCEYVWIWKCAFCEFDSMGKCCFHTAADGRLTLQWWHSQVLQHP